MTTDQPSIEISWAELAPVLFKMRGISRGLWSLGAKLQISGLNAGPTLEEAIPCAFVGFDRLTITPAEGPGGMVFDAATGKPCLTSSDIPQASSTKGATAKRAKKTAKR
jgi:hypothetical protein